MCGRVHTTASTKHVLTGSYERLVNNIYPALTHSPVPLIEQYAEGDDITTLIQTLSYEKAMSKSVVLILTHITKAIYRPAPAVPSERVSSMSQSTRPLDTGQSMSSAFQKPLWHARVGGIGTAGLELGGIIEILCCKYKAILGIPHHTYRRSRRRHCNL